ncbi:SlyX family protein [Pusillimonas sp. SM2304]|uniref:SlyX family protein n=1 Tax=Pusillimonas sp. SM2304 TaxID=3073241 RepID=UPI002875DE65|nr:SlyX family protein [Pusillimonas sp. SM2304]MDS1139357.1 SlyX family protein [Pusillimonas sp. SM2304]
MNTEQRLVDIEIKLTDQEDLVQELNQLVYQQQKQIDELRALCTALVKRLGETAGGDAGADPYAHEKPPHY